MNYSPEMIARLLDLDCAGLPRNFITPAIVAEVMNAQPGRFGYLVCGWPSTADQGRIHDLALLRKYGVTFPEPSTAFDATTVALMDSDDPRVVDMAFRVGADRGFFVDHAGWSGFTAWGFAYEAGIDFGRFFRLDDPRPILAVAG